jgi:long-chain acyl-CoA synthetase
VNDRVETLCQLHRSMSEKMGEKAALRFPAYGRFLDYSYQQVRQLADQAAAGLIGLGINPGDRVGILSENRVEWPIADLAVLSTAAADVTMHAPLSAQQVRYQLGHSEARGVILSNQDQANKVLEQLDELPDLEFLISFDPVSVPESRLVHLTWQDLCLRGELDPVEDELFAREESLDGSSLATLIYTSGTTGNPKGVMLTHGNLLSNVEAMIPIAFLEPDDILLSWLPYSHVYARLTDNYLATGAGITVAMAASIDTLFDDLDAIKPTWLTAVPRFYEKVWSAVESLDPEPRAGRLAAIFGPNIRQLNSGGAPLPRHVCDGFDQAGLQIFEGYGLTETSPVITFNHANAYRFGSVGKAIPGVEIRIAEDGEILTRGPHVMAGYWKNPEATAEVIVDGWFHTGDVGTIDEDGYLSITDRKKDLFVTSAGKNVAPAVIERLLTADPLFEQAVVYGDGRNFISAVVVPDGGELQSVAESLGCEVLCDDGFVTSSELLEYIDSKVEDLMQAVSNPERVKRCLVLEKPFGLADDELTATLKVRRRYIIAKYEDQLATFYDG